MDSIKVTKGGGSSKSSTSIPLAIRFNAEEESIEELVKPQTNDPPLLNSPQQSLEDFSWRTIQGNLFNRNRSGSVEGTSSGLIGSSTHNIISNLSNSDANTIGTWKLIKGKVSQAMEDIKSSKSVQISSSKSEAGGNDDSDQDTLSVNISASDELPLSEQQQLSTSSSILPKMKLASFVTESDSDVDIESTDDIPFSSSSSSLRKSLANLRSRSYIKSKVRSSKHSKSSDQPQQQQKFKKDESPNRFSSSFPSTKAESILKMRRNNDKEKHDSTNKKYHHEIESGIEVVEDMILPSIGNMYETRNNQEILLKDTSDTTGGNDNVLGISIADEMITFKNRPRNDSINNEINDDSMKRRQEQYIDKIKSNTASNNLLSINQKLEQKSQQNISFLQKFHLIWSNLSKKISIIAIIVLLISVLILPLPGFFCGVFTCLFTILLCSSLIDYFKMLLTNNSKNSAGFKSNDYDFSSSTMTAFGMKFKIPDNVHVCEIPAAEEHSPLKSYSGWMNEINNYDPTNHHLSMTTPVFVRLSGSTLTLSNTSSRIPKRAMWNEPIIDKDNIIFTQTRYFNLLGCRVEMCPKGLARKRHFSRKYPIQLIIKNSNTTSDTSTSKVSKLHLEKFEQGIEKRNEQQQQQQKHNDEGNSKNAENELKKRRSLNESNEEIFDKNYNTEDRHSSSGGFDFGNIISNSDIQKLQNNYEIISKEGVPCGDETRLLLFARCDREKEDWYRRFYAASKGQAHDQQEHIPDIVMFTEDEIAVAIKATSALNESGEVSPTSDEKTKKSKMLTEITETQPSEKSNQDSKKTLNEDNLYEGVLISPCALRNLPDYIKFMAKYQKACFQNSNSSASTKVPPSTDNSTKRNRRQKSKGDDLWKGIDQAIFKQQSGNVVWFNILVGRILYNCLNDNELLDRIQEFLQRKLSAIRLPSFMEDIVVDELDLGDTPPLIHRVSQPILDERGTWIDADVSYEGLMHMTITTKLNLLRLKRQQNHEFNDSSSSTILNASSSSIDPINSSATNTNGNFSSNNSPPNNLINSKSSKNASIINCAIYDSNAESTGASSSDSESTAVGTIDPSAESHSSFYTTPGSSRRFLKIVDRITASNLFQSATEISYIQRAMENMSTKITLKVELKGLVSRVVVNLPPPPSDRVWLAFRGPPRLWISAKPTVGEHAFDWSIVTTIIENKLCDEVYKYLVYPNMVDIIVPILGQSTYKEENN